MTDALMFPYTASNVKEIEAFKVAVSPFPPSVRITKLPLGIGQNINLIMTLLWGRFWTSDCVLTQSRTNSVSYGMINCAQIV